LSVEPLQKALRWRYKALQIQAGQGRRMFAASPFVEALSLRHSTKLVVIYAMSKARFFLCAILLFTGCQTGWIKANRMNKLNLGMTRAQVMKILGEPHSTERQGNTETLWYLEDQGNWVHQPYYVTFVDEAVKAYGPGKSAVNVNIQGK
jgi:outer membrane protein assembly factor BamE (lipoprotein component of BamABCDE complex)